MKKILLSILVVGASLCATAQVSPSWSVTQNAAWSATSTGVRFLDAVNPNVVWATGYDGFAPNRNYNWFTRTVNGGATYTSGVVYTGTNPAIGDTNTYVMANLDAIDANTAWVSAYEKAAGAKGAIHRTTNGGLTWQNMTAPGMYTNSASFCNIVTFVTPLIGITQGDAHPGTGNEYEIWRTVDGGSNWTLVPGANIPNPTAGEYALVNVYCKQGSSNIWFGTNKGRIFYSTDAGLTWGVSTLPSVPTASASVNDIAFSTPLIGVAYVFNTSTTPATFEMYNTTNGGITWNSIATVDPNVGRNDICAIPTTTYFASCGAGSGNQLISYSTNNGVNWTDWGSGGIQYLAIDFVDGSNGWAGSFSSQTPPSIDGIYKYTGTLITSSTPPTSAFNAPPVVCVGSGTTAFTATNISTGSNPLTYSWSVSAGATLSSPTATNPTVTISGGAGNYTLTLVATNTVGSNSSSQVISAIACASPSLSFTIPANICNSIVRTFTNTSTGNPTPAYMWSVSPAANVTINPSASAISPSIAFPSGGVYSVTLMGSSIAGTAAITQTVNVNNCAPNASFSIPAAQCATAVVTPSNSTSGNAPITYTWSSSPSAGVNFAPNSVNISPTITINTPGIYTITLRANNPSGLTITTQTINIQNCTSINENKFGSLTEVSPNPTNGNLNITLPTIGDYNLVVVDVLGSVVISEKISNDNKANINLAGKAKGVYFVTVSNKVDKVTKKIVLE